MLDQRDSPGSTENIELSDSVTSKNSPTTGSFPRRLSLKGVESVPFQDHGVIGRNIAGDAALFLLKVAALETVRRFSRAKCPSVWNGLQALQIIRSPPLKWLQRWVPFKILGNTMQMLSRPLLLISVVTALSEHSAKNCTSNGVSDHLEHPDAESESTSLESSENTGTGEEVPDHLSSQSWLQRLYKELTDEEIILPERIDEKELHRFYTAANCDFSCFILSIKKTIRWRETYHILTARELENWSKVVFWHGCDVESRPCLIVKLGLACKSLPAHERPRFAQAIVSQVEYGVLHLVNDENTQIMVLVDCEGLSPLRLPMQVMRSCSLLLQDHFPNRLGCLFVIRLPSVVRVIAQTFIQALNPVTRQKLKFIGHRYLEYLTENLQRLPVYLGSNCRCTICSSGLDTQNSRTIELRSEQQAFSQMLVGEGFSPVDSRPQGNPDMNPGGEQILRTAVIGILMFWTFLAFLAGLYDPEIRPFSSHNQLGDYPLYMDGSYIACSAYMQSFAWDFRLLIYSGAMEIVALHSFGSLGRALSTCCRYEGAPDPDSN